MRINHKVVFCLDGEIPKESEIWYLIAMGDTNIIRVTKEKLEMLKEKYRKYCCDVDNGEPYGMWSEIEPPYSWCEWDRENVIAIGYVNQEEVEYQMCERGERYVYGV